MVKEKEKKKKGGLQSNILRVYLEVFQTINSYKHSNCCLGLSHLSIHINQSEFTPSFKPQPPSNNAVSNLCSTR